VTASSLVDRPIEHVTGMGSALKGIGPYSSDQETSEGVMSAGRVATDQAGAESLQAARLTAGLADLPSTNL
jgi:hypothetical protein